MSLFDSNIKNTVISASTVKDLVNSKDCFNPNIQEDFSEEKLEEIISSITEYIYYSCKAGNWPYDGWEFKESIFGLHFKNPFLDPDTHYEEKRQNIIQYILNRFEELEYIIEYNETKKCFKIKIPDLYAYAPIFKSFNESLQNGWVSANDIIQPSGKVFYMDFPICMDSLASDIGVAGVDNGCKDVVDDRSMP